MDIQKAIEWQKAFKKIYKGMSKEVDEACNMAIETLEKQRAKKPKKRKEPYKSPWSGRDIEVYDVCPRCNTSIGITPYSHCHYCGQAILWECDNE